MNVDNDPKQIAVALAGYVGRAVRRVEAGTEPEGLPAPELVETEVEDDE